MSQMDLTRKTKLTFLIVVSIIAVAAVAAFAFLTMENSPLTSRGPTQPQLNKPDMSKEVPELRTEIVAQGLDHPWDVAFLPTKEMLVAERSGRLLVYDDGQQREISQIEDVRAGGEGGLMGLEVDKDFETNRYIYTCYASTSQDVRLVRWQLGENRQTLSGKRVVVEAIPLNPSGRHSGCRVRMDAQNILWVGTGDAAIGIHPQNPKSLGGKILRVTREGEPARGNVGSPFDPRIFSYGHRNTQGIALYDEPQNGRAGFSVEHGPSVDDEVNKLVKGNFGWNPVPFYNERVPMTDTEIYQDAIEASWSSGNPTIAPSGASFLTGEQWKAWNGMLAIAVLKEEHLRLQKYDENGALQQDDMRFEGDFGRLRSAVQGRDGNLYLTTDNGDNDKVIRVIPE